MSSAPRRLAVPVCALAAPLALALAAAWPSLASAPASYLSWQNKAGQTPVAQPATAVSSSGETYAVPPSPYGQVGDPFVRTLSWSGKGATAKPVPQPEPGPRPTLANIDVPPPPAAELPKGPVSLSAPVPLARPAPVRVPDEAVAVPAKPQPAPQAMAPIPDKAPAPKPAARQAQATAAPVTPPPPAATQQASGDGGYQVPATSKYAARIAAARNVQTDAQPTQPQQQAAAAPAKPAARVTANPTKPAAASTATAPAPAEPLAAQETDHVFIPGEQYTNAADGPRLYSLHRAYGLTPDPITVDRNATGAILDTADLNADEGPNPPKDGGQTDKDTQSSRDTKANQ